MPSRRGCALRPNFFILGAPKCGTTALAGWLREHPAVFMSVPKEPHFFSSDLGNRKYERIDDYLSLFRGASDQHNAVGEASTWYLFSRVAVPRIEELCAGARYIVMTRQPVQMVQSLYLHNVRHLHEDAQSMEMAWWLQEERRGGSRIPGTCREPAFLRYKDVCSLGSQIKRLLDHVPGDRVLHVSLERLQEDPAGEYARVLAFLGLPHEGRTAFESENVARLPRSRMVQAALMRAGRVRARLGLRRGAGLVRFNERRVEKDGISPELTAELANAFVDDQRLLTELLTEVR